jgi:hypothetical protein
MTDYEQGRSMNWQIGDSGSKYGEWKEEWEGFINEIDLTDINWDCFEGIEVSLSEPSTLPCLKKSDLV